MNIKHVTIIGGGSSGWMAAATLSRLCKHLKVTIIESKNFPTVGVGESTLGQINRWFNMLGISDDMWMKDCNATYKNSIRFTNFRNNDGQYFEYPFGGFDFEDKHNGLNSWSELACLYPEIFPPESFAEFFNTSNTLLVKHNKQTNNYNGALRHFNFNYDTAYHMDATAFGQWLKNNIALKEGVELIHTEIESCTKDTDGNIDTIICVDGQVLKSDLWIDCTGFKSMLLEQWMNQEFVSFGDQLANDSAWACPIEYADKSKEITNVTDCHALSNGWVWNTPLWSRIGTGYVYSSKFTSKEEAKEEFKNHLITKFGEDRVNKTTMRHIDIKHGYRKTAWSKNVIGIGLSYGFIEPLESTGLLTTHENLIRLADVLNRRSGYITRTEIDGYNYSVEIILLGFRDFVSMHYGLSNRTDTPYWKWCTQVNEYQPKIFDEYALKNGGYSTLLGNLNMSNTYPQDMQGATFITAGMGIKSISTPEMVKSFYKFHNVDLKLIEDAKNSYLTYKQSVEQYVSTLPTSYEYLLDNIYGTD
jgi:flavin-dependent dehydrogenase